jgi:hypothetical protein
MSPLEPRQATFDLDRARQDRDAGIQRADTGTPEAWKDAALEAVRSLAHSRETFTTDDVWPLIAEPDPPNARAMAGVMLRAAAAGWIANTNRSTKSARAGMHRQPITLWRSLVCARKGAA